MRDVRDVRRVLHVGWRSMIGRQGVVRPLTHHVVPIRVAVRRLTHRRTCLVAWVVEVRRRDLRAPLLRWSIATIRPRRRLHWAHPAAGHKRLRLGVECVAVEAARDGMLALWVTRIDVGWEGTISVGDPIWSYWRGPRLVRARIEARRLLPPVLRLRWTLHGWSIWCGRHLIHRRLVTRRARRLGILSRTLSVYRSGHKGQYTGVHQDLRSTYCYTAGHSRCPAPLEETAGLVHRTCLGPQEGKIVVVLRHLFGHLLACNGVEPMWPGEGAHTQVRKRHSWTGCQRYQSLSFSLPSLRH